MPTQCLYPFSSHADIPDTCVHYMGGLLDALIQGLKEVRTLVQGCGRDCRVACVAGLGSWLRALTSVRLHFLECPAEGALALQQPEPWQNPRGWLVLRDLAS